MNKISIITVCYNAEDTICKTIDSVLNQTYPSIEYIIIDGSSSDNTCKYIKEYERKILDRGYEFIFLSERDTGIYDAMNKGIALSTGSWIHFRNSGDYFFNNEVIENIFNSEINSSTEIIHGDIRFWDKYGYCDKKPSVLSKSYKLAMPVWHPSSFIKSELHKKLLYDTTFRLSGDYDFFYKCYELNVVFQYLPIIVALFNIEEGESINNRELSLNEDLRLKGLNNSTFHQLNFILIKYYISLRRLLKKIFPPNYTEKNQIKTRLQNGWVINV